MFLCPVTGSQASPPSALLKMTDGNSVQLQLRQERLRDGEIYDFHLGASSSGAGVPDRLQTVSELRTESPQRPDKLPPLIFLAFDLESDVGSVDISPGVDQEPMCFQGKPDPPV